MPPPNDLGFYAFTKQGFYETVTSAVNDMAANGFDSMERLQFWITRIRQAAIRHMVPLDTLERTLNRTMQQIYRSKVEQTGILKKHDGVSRFTLDRVKPKLRAELDRRIMASANLINLNRAASIEKTIQRFSGWATSIPAGGSDISDRKTAKADVRKALASLPFEERRVAVDQGHKLTAALNDILAVDGGAIAAIWHSHYKENGYDARIEHAKIDGQIFLIRDSWASQKGFVKSDGGKYTDDIERPAELVNCRCYYQYIYHLRSLPSDMLTERGKAELARVRVAA